MARLTCESLEDRAVPTTYVFTGAPTTEYFYDETLVDPGQPSQSIPLIDWAGIAGTPWEAPAEFTGTGTATFEYGQMTHISGVWTFDTGYTWTLDIDVDDMFFTYVDSRPGGETGQNPFEWQQVAAMPTIDFANNTPRGNGTPGQLEVTATWANAPQGGGNSIKMILHELASGDKIQLTLNNFGSSGTNTQTFNEPTWSGKTVYVELVLMNAKGTTIALKSSLSLTMP
jgi:hypothetical protein